MTTISADDIEVKPSSQGWRVTHRQSRIELGFVAAGEDGLWHALGYGGQPLDFLKSDVNRTEMALRLARYRQLISEEWAR